MTDEKSNELIAEFMGLAFIGIDDQTGEKIWGNVPGPIGHCIGLEFDTSWDWLMPVVEKIESIDVWDEVKFSVDIDRYGCSIRWAIRKTGSDKRRLPLPFSHTIKDGESKITAAHSAVVEFIRWFNSESPCERQEGGVPILC